MNRTAFLLILTLLALLALGPAVPPVAADGKTKAVQETVEFVLRKFGRETAKDGAQALARRLERAALAHGDEVLQAVRLTGPRGLQLIEQAGGHSRQVARLLAAHGEEAAVFVAARPRALQLLARHGEDAAAVLVKTKGVAEPALAALGTPAVRAFQALGTPQNARRLAMMAAEGGELAQIGRTTELLAVIARYGDKAMEFIWKHKGALAVSATLAAFLAHPEPFLQGTQHLVGTVAEAAVKPIAEVPAEIARHTNWTPILLVITAILTLLAALRQWLFRRPGPVLAVTLPPPPATPAPPPVAHGTHVNIPVTT